MWSTATTDLGMGPRPARTQWTLKAVGSERAAPIMAGPSGVALGLSAAGLFEIGRAELALVGAAAGEAHGTAASG
jgi:hypothetical protein